MKPFYIEGETSTHVTAESLQRAGEALDRVIARLDGVEPDPEPDPDALTPEQLSIVASTPGCTRESFIATRRAMNRDPR